MDLDQFSHAGLTQSIGARGGSVARRSGNLLELIVLRRLAALPTFVFRSRWAHIPM
ncbi:MAG TPA: hypothetical protein VKR06_22405 [Ktedonosporobacter sp.]|nr:hypothetical protein [Ktedonosporobacter sp.]